jgi:hypothetical protein
MTTHIFTLEAVHVLYIVEAPVPFVVLPSQLNCYDFKVKGVIAQFVLHGKPVTFYYDGKHLYPVQYSRAWGWLDNSGNPFPDQLRGCPICGAGNGCKPGAGHWNFCFNHKDLRQPVRDAMHALLQHSETLMV